jgi:drug/metabolite transporter (DMT)-like permease
LRKSADWLQYVLMPKRYSLSTALAITTTVLLWGSAFAGIRAGLEAYTPAHLALLRFLAASLALGGLAVLRRTPLPARADLPKMLLLGLLGIAFYNIALNTGQRSIAAGPAALLIQTAPIWTALLATVFLGERLRRWAWAGMALSFAGILVIAVGKGQDLDLRWGAALILMASFSMSGYNVIQKRMLRRYPAVALTTYSLWAGTLLLLPFAPGLAAEVAAAPPAATFSVIYLGVGPAALAYATWAFALSRLPAGRAASFLYAVPVMAFLFGWVWLGEIPHAADLAGGALALGGVVLVNTLGRQKTDGFQRRGAETQRSEQGVSPST